MDYNSITRNISIDRFLEIHIWLTTTIPTDDWSWNHEVGNDAVEFKNEEDAVLFRLIHGV